MSTEVEMLRKELHDHVLYCETRFSEGSLMHQKLLSEQQRTNEQLDRLVENTATVVQWSQDMKGAARLAAGMQSVGSVIIKIPFIGIALYAMYMAVIKFFSEWDGPL